MQLKFDPKVAMRAKMGCGGPVSAGHPVIVVEQYAVYLPLVLRNS